MREAVGGSWLFQIVIVFILLFAGFMALSINHSKAFSVKDKIIQTIQSYNGMDLTRQCVDGENTAICAIASYLTDSAYRTNGRCPDNVTVNNLNYSYQGFTREGKLTSSGNAAFCIAMVSSEDSITSNSCSSGCITSELPSMAYYRVVVFYQLDLPIFHDLFNFDVTGDTKLMLRGSA